MPFRTFSKQIPLSHSPFDTPNSTNPAFFGDQHKIKNPATTVFLRKKHHVQNSRLQHLDLRKVLLENVQKGLFGEPSNGLVKTVILAQDRNRREEDTWGVFVFFVITKYQTTK